MTPAFQIVAAGIDITAMIRTRLLGLTITDEAGIKSDTLEIELDDRDSAIELPMPGALIAVAIGYKGSLLVPQGIYTAEEVTLSGPPDRMVIRARATNFGGSLKDQKTRGWEDKTIGDIVAIIAGEHGLEGVVSTALSSFNYKRLDQTEESDMNFLRRIADNHDATTSAKGGKLIFAERAKGLSVSGLAIPPALIRRKGVLDWSVTRATRGAFGAVEAAWYDHEAGNKISVKVGDGVPVKKLKRQYLTEDEATRAAQAEFDACGRGDTSLSISMPGDPSMFAAQPMIVSGFRFGIDGLWTCERVVHSITDGGFLTSVEAAPILA